MFPTLALLLLFIASPVISPVARGSMSAAQGDSRAAYLGAWEYDSPQVRFTLLLRPDGTGYLADEVDSFPFTYSLDVRHDPARLDLTYEVDMAFGRLSHTLVRLERTEQGDRLHWVSCHSDSGPPEWPETNARTPSGVSWITFLRAESCDCINLAGSCFRNHPAGLDTSHGRRAFHSRVGADPWQAVEFRPRGARGL